MSDGQVASRPAPLPVEERGPLSEVIALFLKLGFIAFGGPAAHIAMMREEVVRRRGWISDQRFLDLMGVVNLIPGPNSTELAIHLGYVRAGWPGLVAAGIGFIGPAFAIVLALAWAYVQYGAMPQAAALLYGVKPVILAIIAQALWGLGRTALGRPLPAVFAAVTLILYLAGGNEIALLFGMGFLHALIRWATANRGGGTGKGVALLLPFAGTDGGTGAAASVPAIGTVTAAAAATAVPFHLPTLFLTFLKIGAVLYGSGYVLLAFLRNDFIYRLGWLTDRQLLDAISIGQFTPGPVFTTATFIGYLMGSWTGAILATLGIFLPSFLFVAAIQPLAATLRRSTWTSAALDGVNVASLALMAGVTIQLGRSALLDLLTWGLALGALLVLIRFRVNSAWLIAAGGVMGYIASIGLA